MGDSGDSYDDMERFALDQDTADRLLSGALAPEDAPHRYGEVASLLRMAAGPTAGALDDNLLFYLKARGLPEKQAQALLIQAFVGEAIEQIADDGLREHVIGIAERWLERRQ